jgi:hypothetical protein
MVLAAATALAVAVPAVPAPSAGALSTAWRRDAGRELRGVVVDDGGNSFVTGYARSGSRRLQTLIVAKYAADGTRRWLEKWRPDADTQAVGNDIAIGRDGRVYVAGALLGTDDDGPSGWFVRAYGPGGDVRWHRDQQGWRGQHRRSAALGIDVGGDLVAVAVTTEGGSGYHEGSVRAYGGGGSLEWTDDFEVSGYGTYDRATDIAVGGRAVVVVGEIDQKRITADRPVVDQEIVVQRLGSGSGNVRWILVMKDADVRDADSATGVGIRGDVLAVVGRIDGGPVTGPRSQRGHAWTARIGSTNGSLAWQRVWGQANRKAAEPDAVAIGPGGTIRTAGTVRGGGDGVDAFLRSYGPDGSRAGFLRMRSGRFLHGTGVATATSGGRLWLTAWRGTREDDRPDGGHLWELRP